MTITLTWWMIPTIILVVGLIYAIIIHDDGGGYFSGVGNVFLLVPVLGISLIAWIIAAILK